MSTDTMTPDVLTRAEFRNAIFLALAQHDLYRALIRYDQPNARQLVLWFSAEAAGDALEDVGRTAGENIAFKLDAVDGTKKGEEPVAGEVEPAYCMVFTNQQVAVPEELEVEVESPDAHDTEVEEQPMTVERVMNAMRRRRRISVLGEAVLRQLCESGKFRCPVCNTEFELTIRMVEKEKKPKDIQEPEGALEEPKSRDYGGGEPGGEELPPPPEEMGGGGEGGEVGGEEENLPPLESTDYRKRFDKLLNEGK